ncbi:MAG: hypothetical protein KJ737_25690 [Proteobacteria bacterium]|nr:hypothetical protein [Pseudomonadota bacterium]
MSWNPLALFWTPKRDYENDIDQDKNIFIIRPLIPYQESVIRGVANDCCKNVSDVTPTEGNMDTENT